MKQTKSIHYKFTQHETFLDDIINNYESKGEDFGNQKRNSLKLFKLEGKRLNVKSFKIPNMVNQIAYGFLRRSKAQRSFEYAQKLQSLDIGTPQPVAYYQFSKSFLFKKSYYISEHQDYDLTYRELTHDFNYPDYDAILRAFTRFTYKMHIKGIKFLDHSPGNTLIKKSENGYDFYLVDLNRMEFKQMGFEERIKNFDRLTIHKSMVEIMSDEYAKVSGEDYETIVRLMWQFTEEFQAKHHKKQRMKKRLKFWKK
ncbi:lipopolysaccharide kinase InaA family protein [Winogradskyella sp. 4-2091]|uniref:lipopolysaccharide kinase InaA family protein n=1 Tax=Winogradskyella sp. 4-2091 TaxID=3381659 RepID=UPI0038924270